MYQFRTRKPDIDLELDFYNDKLKVELRDHRIGEHKILLHCDLKELENVSAALVLFKAITNAIKENVKDVAI